jgi:alpha-beta hydrolase superfamily lysophospholipase
MNSDGKANRAELNSGVVGYWHWPNVDRRMLPLIVVGHGFGAEWTFATSETISDFTEAGLAVFTFDYRHYGESVGEPRQLLNIKKELNDWRMVLAYVRRHSLIDTRAARLHLPL